jgi:hypothetical protein
LLLRAVEPNGALTANNRFWWATQIAFWPGIVVPRAVAGVCCAPRRSHGC